MRSTDIFKHPVGANRRVSGCQTGSQAARSRGLSCPEGWCPRRPRELKSGSSCICQGGRWLGVTGTLPHAVLGPEVRGSLPQVTAGVGVGWGKERSSVSPSHFLSHPIGENVVTWSCLAARDTGKCSLPLCLSSCVHFKLHGACENSFVIGLGDNQKPLPREGGSGRDDGMQA